MKNTPECCRGRKLPPDMAKAARVGAALADGNRLRIACLLKGGERCVCEIWENLALPQNLVSHHLKALKDAGLLRSRRAGLKVFYSLDRQAWKAHLAALNNFIKPTKKV